MSINTYTPDIRTAESTAFAISMSSPVSTLLALDAFKLPAHITYVEKWSVLNVINFTPFIVYTLEHTISAFPSTILTTLIISEYSKNVSGIGRLTLTSFPFAGCTLFELFLSYTDMSIWADFCAIYEKSDKSDRIGLRNDVFFGCVVTIFASYL